MVTAMDEAIDNITDALKETGLMDDTLIVFSPDNGGWPRFGGNNYPLRGGKITIFEGGTRAAAFVHGAGLEKKGYTHNGLMHSVDWNHTIIAAAGGKTEAPRKIDGINLWDAVSAGEPFKRNELVYNIDDAIFRKTCLNDNRIDFGCFYRISENAIILIGTSGITDADFQSHLDETTKKKAKDELHELNDKDRELAVQSFRQWILEQKWLRTPTDFKFLLRFIRVRKYSQLNARESLENYWTQRTKFPQWFKDVDPKDKLMQEILRAGFYVVPRDTDKDGCRVVIENLGHVDVQKVKKEWGIANVFKAMILIFDWLIYDERAQVNGIKFLSDMSEINMAQVMTFFKDQDEAMKYFTKALPVRLKGFFVYNEPAFFDLIWAMVAPLMSQKLKGRMSLLGKNMVKVYDNIPMNLLPDEYLPDDYTGPSQGSSQQLIEEMVEDMCKPEFRNYIMDLSSDKYGVDLEQKKQQRDKLVPVASFRKLNID